MKITALLLSVSLLLMPFIKRQEPCAVMKQGSFKYLDADDTTAYFDITGEKHTEYHQNKKYYIKSDMKWVDDCTYELTMTGITIPNFPFKTGDKMKVEILRVEKDIIFYRSTVMGNSWDGRLKKLY